MLETGKDKGTHSESPPKERPRSGQESGPVDSNNDPSFAMTLVFSLDFPEVPYPTNRFIYIAC